MPIFGVPANVIIGGTIQPTDVANLYIDISGLLDSQNIKTGGLIGANLANGTVAITQIKNASVATGVSPTVGNHSNGLYLNMPSGAYGFMPGVSTDSNASTRVSLGGWRTADGVGEFDLAKPTGISYQLGSTIVNAVVWLAVLNPAVTGASSVGVVTAFYIQTSPPYDLGDGEIPLFVFLMVHKNGDIIASYVAHDPPWARPFKPSLKLPVGLTDALDNPDHIVQKADGAVPAKTKSDVLTEALDAAHANIQNLEMLRVKVHSVTNPEANAAMHAQIRQLEALIWDQTPETQDQKNENMAVIPHPWVANKDLPADTTIVMLDPMAANTKRLIALHRAGENVPLLLHGGYVDIGNTHITGRKGPPGLMIVNHSLKNSKGVKG